MYPSVLPSLYSQHAGKNTTPIPECMASIPFSYALLQKCGVNFWTCLLQEPQGSWAHQDGGDSDGVNMSRVSLNHRVNACE